jgi:hypothetical protein
MKWQILVYVASCVAAPIAWGLLVVWASNWVERTVRRRDKSVPQGDLEETPIPPIEYHI